MGIIFKVLTENKENKSDILKILIEILKYSEEKGIEIYEKTEDDDSVQ